MPCWGCHYASIYPPSISRTTCLTCPSCAGLPMHMREVAPHWSMAKIDVTYECSNCGISAVSLSLLGKRTFSAVECQLELPIEAAG